jgi:uncharacterized protein (DUF1015 family)
LPEIRAFRALRFDPSKVGDLSRVICPPYDVIGPELHQVLLARHPANAVRLDLPDSQGGEADERYRIAARTLSAWRMDGTLHKDGQPSIYAYEQTYRVPASDKTRTQRGFFGRLCLENLVPGSGVLPHEKTLSAPKEDRYKLLRATGVNTSPVVGLFADPSGRSVQALAEIASAKPDVDVVDDDGVRHRLWAVPEDGPKEDIVRSLLEAAGRDPITIADGHHRYETALRYRDERRTNKSGESDPSADYVMMLLLETTEQKLTVLPTHRVVRGLGDEGVSDLLAHSRWLFDVKPVESRAELEAAFASIDVPGGEGRFGLWTRKGGAVLVARREDFAVSVKDRGAALHRLDVSLLQVALNRLCRVDAAATAAGRLAYTKSVVEALDWVDTGRDGADAAFLLDPTPVAEIAAVAAEGNVMPQKSTYFYPKALTGLVINPHEW